MLLLGVSSLLHVLWMLRVLWMETLLSCRRMEPPSSDGRRRDRSDTSELLFQRCIPTPELVDLAPLFRQLPRQLLDSPDGQLRWVV